MSFADSRSSEANSKHFVAPLPFPKNIKQCVKLAVAQSPSASGNCSGRMEAPIVVAQLANLELKRHLIGQTSMFLVPMESSSKMPENGVDFVLIS